MPCEQTPRQPTPSPSGTHFPEDLFFPKKKVSINSILNFKGSELTFSCILKPSQANEPPICTPTRPIPGPSEIPASQVPPIENYSTCEPEPEVSLTHSMEITIW
ncbi:hypothetical protein O181_002412 [Austropuccinia psidii MF-1]|uniref:Uncharacterized protein n=1 Tax=Austropuccinia psidii MF-1 TaxID=1389203 RepID=A0A9Q3BCF1_9BASI|nr:hypothetical protein [Austropuccinia psidii MF-1]